MQLPSILCAALTSLSVTLLCVTDFVSAIKQNVSTDLWQNFLVRLSNKIVGLDLPPFSEMVVNHCCRRKTFATTTSYLLVRMIKPRL